MSLWMRLYTEALFDPKIRSLRPELRCVLFDIWLLVAHQNGAPFTVETLSLLARYKRDWSARAVRELLERSLIEACSDPHLKDHYLPHNWLKRQFKSDQSDPTHAERQKRYRDGRRKRHAYDQIQSTEVEKGNIPLGNISRSLPAERVTRNAAEAAASGGSLEGSPPAAAAEAERPAPPTDEDRARVAAALENFRRGCVLPNGQDDAPVH